MTQKPQLRHAVRGLLITPENKLLLMKIEAPDGRWKGWIAPGGGTEPGEDPRRALERELFEELGLKGAEIGAHVWNRRHVFERGDRLIEQVERYYRVATSEFEPTDRHQPDGLERKDFRGFKWWGAAELVTSREEFAPRRMGLLMEELLSRGATEGVQDVGV